MRLCPWRPFRSAFPPCGDPFRDSAPDDGLHECLLEPLVHDLLDRRLGA
jgi:hypothetical protein